MDVPLTTLQREAQRLVQAGLLRDRTVGRGRLLLHWLMSDEPAGEASASLAKPRARAATTRSGKRRSRSNPLARLPSLARRAASR
jgi:hypothetical protein